MPRPKPDATRFEIRRPHIVKLEFIVTGRHKKGHIGGKTYEEFVEAAAAELGRRLTQAGYVTDKLRYESIPETCADGIFNVRIIVREKAPRFAETEH